MNWGGGGVEIQFTVDRNLPIEKYFSPRSWCEWVSEWVNNRKENLYTEELRLKKTSYEPIQLQILQIIMLRSELPAK